MNKPVSLMRPMAKALACVALLTTLSGCVGLVAGGAVMTAVSVNDRRTLGAQTEDKAIAVKGESRARSIVGEQGHVNVTSFNLTVLLTGEAPDEATKADVENIVKGVPSVRQVINEITIGPPSSFSERSNDTYITTKVKSRMVDARKFHANHVKVVTEAGVVYLMGLVKHSEADAATGRFDLDERFQPEQAARTGTHDLDRKTLTSGLLGNRGRDLVGADGAGRGIA